MYRYAPLLIAMDPEVGSCQVAPTRLKLCNKHAQHSRLTSDENLLFIMSFLYDSFRSEGILCPSRYGSTSASVSVASTCWHVHFHPEVETGVCWINAASEMTLAEKRNHGYPSEREGAVSRAQMRKANDTRRAIREIALQAPIPMDWELVPEPKPFPPPPPAPKKACQSAESCGMSPTKLFVADDDPSVTMPAPATQPPSSVAVVLSAAPPDPAAQPPNSVLDGPPSVHLDGLAVDYTILYTILYDHYNCCYYGNSCLDCKTSVLGDPCNPYPGTPREVHPIRAPPEPPPFLNLVDWYV
jgi:hypothetical protein